MEVGRREGIVSGRGRNGGRDGEELDVQSEGFNENVVCDGDRYWGWEDGACGAVVEAFEEARVPGAGGKFGLIAPLGRLFREGRLRRRRRRDWCVLNLAGKAHWAVMAVLQW